MSTEKPRRTTIQDIEALETNDEVKPSIRSCMSCEKANVCKLFEMAANYTQQITMVAKQSNVDLDVFPAEHIGQRCSQYKSGVDDIE